MKFEIVEGPMRAGKTTYAKSKESPTCIYFSHDDMVGTDFQQMYDRVVKKLKENPDKDAVVDGWFSIYNKDCIGSVLNLAGTIPQEVVVTVPFTSFDTIWGRRATCGTPFTREDITRIYKRLVSFYRVMKDVKFSFLDFSDGYRSLSFEEFMQKLRMEMLTATEKDIDDFLAHLAAQGHDRYYQTINLPYGKGTKGYERTEITWDILKNSLDFRGKRVFDIGCYHGFIPFGIEDRGALQVVGVDNCTQANDIANRLKAIWNYDVVEFQLQEAKQWAASADKGRYDIALCFNMIQYVHPPEGLVRALFDVADTVVFEAHTHYQPSLFDPQAKGTHQLYLTQESPRWHDLRRLLFYYKRV